MSVDSLALVQTAFAGWYRQFQLEENSAQIQARLAGVAAITKSQTTPQIEALIRLAFASKRPAATTEVDKIRQAFTTADEEFPQNGNNAELQVLAASCLAHMMEVGKSPSITALAIATASCSGARNVKLPMDLVGRANAVLDKRSEINRNRNSISTSLVDPKALDFSAIQKKLQEQNDWSVLATGIGEMQVTLKKSFADQAKQVKDIFDALINNVRMKDEELDMLWWLTGERSEDLDCAFDSIPTEAQPLVLAKELADLTTLLPGPASAKALLSRAGLKERKKIKLTGAVNAVTKEWAEAHVQKEEYSPVTTPIHFALHRRLETDGGNEWIANWSSVTGIVAEFDTSPLMLGLLFYRERLWLQWS